MSTSTFWLINLFLFFTICNSVIFNCAGRSWRVVYEDNANYTKVMQKWLLDYQFNSTKCKVHGPYEESFDIGDGGLGASYALHALRDMLIALPKNQVFRPPVGFLWADLNASVCTNNWPSFDCYLKSYSNCHPTTRNPHNKHYEFNSKTVIHNSELDEEYKQYYLQLGEYSNICHMAQTFNKPLQWVMGQVLLFLTRPNHNIQSLVSTRINKVLSHITPESKWMAVHVRTGTPDQGRKTISVDRYVAHIDELVRNYEHVHGSPIKLVYLASQSNADTFGNITSFNEKYPRHFKWYFLPNYILPNSSTVEIEVMLKSENSTALSRVDMMVDFLVDLELFAQADYFLGSRSTIYLAATLLRYARKFLTVEHSTCMLYSDNELLCEGSMEIIKRIWRWYYMYDSGFVGGSYRNRPRNLLLD